MRSYTNVRSVAAILTIATIVAFPLAARAITVDSAVKAPSAKQAHSALYSAVDRSFSAVAMDTPLARARARLAERRVGGCELEAGCDWLDANRVRHVFSGDSPSQLVLVIKSVRAADFGGRAISALGIGTARDQRTVMANVARFAPRLRFTCSSQGVSGNVGPVECSAMVDPGWVQIGFTRGGALQAVRFDANHFM
jgi:hypothetical protein